ncbi:F-box protein PP2-A13-like [Curcuma longa]|uniref:F-box protein PP2-A13-like n=1 Tax=Curcuma longa TaxID=136217 RepID=UPI003D9ED322
MGSWISSIVRAEADAEAGLGDLPESCIAEVLLRLDAQEICRASGLNRAFRIAASADFVWEAKLPKNYVYLMEMATDGTAISCVCKKEIYARLCRPNPFDGGTKEFWLELNRGGICVSISSKALLITGINDKRYWKYLPTESVEPEGAMAVGPEEQPVLTITGAEGESLYPLLRPSWDRLKGNSLL